MNNRIFQVLEKLETQSIKEKTRQVRVARNKRMLAITRETGEFFNLILRTKNAKKALEIGTSVGYSTLWLAEALSRNSGKIITIEENQEKIKLAEKNFKDSRVSSMIKIQHGKALEVLKAMNKKKTFTNFFDFVLIDADKENSLSYFQLVLPLVKVGGIIATDNMLYPKKFRKDMAEYSKKVRKDKRVRSVLVPIGNGEEITIKMR